MVKVIVEVVMVVVVRVVVEVVCGGAEVEKLRGREAKPMGVPYRDAKESSELIMVLGSKSEAGVL